MVRPVKTTVTEAPARIEPLDTVTMVRVPVGTEADAVATTPSPLISTPGVPTPAKKPCGYVRVMLLPVASAPPGELLKLSVARTLVLPTIRSMAATSNRTDVTAPPIGPLKTDDGDDSSALVDMEILAPAVGKSPIVKPVKVTKTTLFPST